MKAASNRSLTLSVLFLAATMWIIRATLVRRIEKLEDLVVRIGCIVIREHREYGK